MSLGIILDLASTAISFTEYFDKDKPLIPITEDGFSGIDYSTEDTVVLKINGIATGYTNKQLKSAFYVLYNKIVPSRLTPVNKHIMKYDFIVPVETEPSIINRVINGILKYFAHGSVAGFFTPTYNRIFLLISSFSNIFRNVSVELMKERAWPLINHEFTHFYAYNFPRKFWSVYKSKLKVFYKNFFSLYFNDVLEQNKIDKLVNSFMNTLKQKYFTSKSSPNGAINSIYMWWFALYKTAKNSNNDKLISKVEKILMSINALSQMDLNYYVMYLGDVFAVLNDTYIKSFGITSDKARSLYIQELIIPDEVICIYNQINVNNRDWENFYYMITKLKIKPFYKEKEYII